MRFLLILSLFASLLLAAPKTVTLKKDFVLGGGDAPEMALFSATAKLAVAPDGKMYVLDSGNQRITVFDAAGTFLFKFGNKGKGPGEFLEPMAMTIDDQGQVWLFDTGQHKLTVFDAQGKYVRDQRFSNSIHGVFTPTIFANGHYAMTAYRLNSEFQVTYELVLQDAASQDVASFSSYSVPKIEWEKMEQPTFWRSFLTDQFVAVAVEMPMAARVGDRLLMLEKNAYEGQIVDASGKQVGSIKGSHKPRALSDDAKYALCEPIWQDLAANPALSPGMTTRIFSDALDDLELMVVPPIAAVTNVGAYFAVLQGFDPLKRQGQLDFWDKQGQLVGSAAYQGTHQFLTGIEGFLYSVGYNEDVVITRYQVAGL